MMVTHVQVDWILEVLHGQPVDADLLTSRRITSAMSRSVCIPSGIKSNIQRIIIAASVCVFVGRNASRGGGVHDDIS